jgi:hypothetical protein
MKGILLRMLIGMIILVGIGMADLDAVVNLVVGPLEAAPRKKQGRPELSVARSGRRRVRNCLFARRNILMPAMRWPRLAGACR